MLRTGPASLLWVALCCTVACGGGSSGTQPDLCDGVEPLALRVSPTRVRVGGVVILTASGGTGQYAYRLEDGGSGGEVKSDRFIAGSTPGNDTLLAEDGQCPLQATAGVEVVAAFRASPSLATIRPGTGFQIAVEGMLGTPEFLLRASDSGSTVSATGAYRAGATEGRDLIVVRDTKTGDEVPLRYELRADAKLQAEPSQVLIPSGSSIRLRTRGATDTQTWSLISGPGQVLDGRFEAPASGGGLAVLQATDAFTQETARVSVRIMDEITRNTVPHGRLADTASVLSADLDGDGLADVAVGQPDSDLERVAGGAVFIYKGAATGELGEPTWILKAPSESAQFGDSLAAGDLDGDGRAELVVSSPGADVTGDASGAVYIYHFGAEGPVLVRSALTGTGRGSVGAGLALADLDADGDLDLLVGAPTGDLAGTNDQRGIVDVFLLQPRAAVPDRSTFRLGGVDLLADGGTGSRAGTQLGRALAVGDLNGDGRMDLAARQQVNTFPSDGGAPLSRTGINVYLGRAQAPLFRSSPDAVVAPSNLLDGSEGNWRLGILPAQQSRPALLMAISDQADSPDLSAAGGFKSGSESGGVLLFDLSALGTAAEPPVPAVRFTLTDAYARFYGDASGIVMGRSWALADVDGTEGPELLLGAVRATVGSGASALRNAGKVFVYPLTGLARGTVTNRPALTLDGTQKYHVLGAGLGSWNVGGALSLLAVAGRASTTAGEFTGRLEVWRKSDASWTFASSTPLPARVAAERFGEALALGRNVAGQPFALVGAPGYSSQASQEDGSSLNIGRAVGTVLNPTGPAAAVFTGATTPSSRGREVGTDVTFTDFNGDGRQDAVASAPSYSVPSLAQQATEIAPVYTPGQDECYPSTGSAVNTGAVLVSLAQADGSFTPAYRLWKLGVTTVGRAVVGGFDLNGDGKQDLAVGRSKAVELFLGRAPLDASLTKLTPGCDAVYTAVAADISLLAPVGDLDGDGCAEVAYRQGVESISVLFGFDAGGARCGGKTTATVVRIAAGTEVGLPGFGLGLAVLRAGKVLGGAVDHLAVSASSFPVNGVPQGAVLLYDVATVVGQRPSSGEALVPMIGGPLEPQVVSHPARASGFGRSLAGGVDVDADGVPELIVGAPSASESADAVGAVYAYRGGPSLVTAPSLLLLAVGDGRERASFGQRLSLLPAQGGGPPMLGVGAPLSYRTGTRAGTAFSFPLSF